MKLKDEPDRLIAFSCKLVVVQARHRLAIDRHPSAVRLIEETQNIKQSAFAAAGRAHDSVDTPRSERTAVARQSVGDMLVEGNQSKAGGVELTLFRSSWQHC